MSRFQRSIFDPVVLAAFVTVISGGVVFVLGDLREADRAFDSQLFEERQARCDRAFASLRDENLHPTLQDGESEWFERQRRIALECSEEVDR